MRRRLALAVLAALAATGCGDSDVDGTLGENGEGVFRYTCIEDGDARCNETAAVSSIETSGTLGVNLELPHAIAVDARFDLTYVGDAFDDGDFLVVDIEPARGDLVTHAGGFQIAVPGPFAFLARNGPRRRVIDFIHLEARRVEELAVWHAQAKITALDLAAGATTDVAVVPTDGDGTALAGALGFNWTTSDPSVVVIEGTGINEDEVQVTAAAAGSATITVTQGELSRQIDVTVSPP